MFDILLGMRDETKEVMISVINRIARNLSVPASIEEAINLFHSRKFDIALIDENFGGEDEGWGLAKEIKSSLTYEKVKVIMFSGTYHKKSHWQSTTTGWRENVDYVLVYPLDVDEIPAEVERQMQSA